MKQDRAGHDSEKNECVLKHIRKNVVTLQQYIRPAWQSGRKSEGEHG